jgi:hypothetical protein
MAERTADRLLVCPRSGTFTRDGYWMGVSRNSPAEPWQSVSEGLVGQEPGMAEPYGHWAWTFWARTATAGSNCVQARSAVQYDLFLGDTSKASDANDQRLYTAQVGRRAAGWPRLHGARGRRGCAQRLGPVVRGTPADVACPRPGPAVLQHGEGIRLGARAVQQQRSIHLPGARRGLRLPAAAQPAAAPAAPAAATQPARPSLL